MYHGNEEVRVEERPKPVIGGSGDAIIRATRTAICGSDLHLYHGDIPDTRDGGVLGREFMGVVEDIGPQVTRVRPGDRVVVAEVIADGTCCFCKQELFSLCETTNPNPVMQALYGQHTAGLFGDSHLTDGYYGGQAEYVRVPYADVGYLKVPDERRDAQVLPLADAACTGWMAAERSGVGPGQTVAVFGCGPIGLLAMAAARTLGAQRLIAIDRIGYRLDCVRERFGAETINFDEDEPVKTLRELTLGRGPDVCIEAAGFRYSRTMRHTLQMKMKPETDAIDALADAIRSIRKGGTVAVIGDFIGWANQFPTGAVMEKGLTVWGSQVHVQRLLASNAGAYPAG